MFHRIGYKFTKKRNPKKGVMSTSLGLISAISIYLAVYFTFLNHGEALMQYGAVILLCMVYSAVGFVLGVMSCREQDIYRLFPIAGVVLNTIGLLTCGFILYIGVFGL